MNKKNFTNELRQRVVHVSTKQQSVELSYAGKKPRGSRSPVNCNDDDIMVSLELRPPMIPKGEEKEPMSDHERKVLKLAKELNTNTPKGSKANCRDTSTPSKIVVYVANVNKRNDFKTTYSGIVKDSDIDTFISMLKKELAKENADNITNVYYKGKRLNNTSFYK